MKTIKDLEKIGFQYAGKWFLPDNSNKISFELINDVQLVEDVLYAFISNDIVKYVGITEKTLKARMINYKSGHEENNSSGSTNKKVNQEIKRLLLKKIEVLIYCLKGFAPCDFFGYRISLSTGIEKSLIQNFDENNNMWNIRGVANNSNLKNSSIIKTQKTTSLLLNNQTIVKVGKESINKGFILFKNDINQLLPIESEGMDIHYKDKILSGWFTRSQKNKKVNGYNELKLIMNSDFKFGEKILVTILNPNEIKIEKYND